MYVTDKTLFDRIGGRPTLVRVHSIFYTKCYAHPWLGKYFAHKPQEVLEAQQTDFMQYLMGGPNLYAGKTPKSAHQHINVTDELFNLRHELLHEALTEAGLDEALIDEWIKTDARMYGAVVKKSINDCVKTYHSQEILDFKRQA